MNEFGLNIIDSAFTNFLEKQDNDNKMAEIACRVTEAIEPLLAGLNIDEVERVLDFAKLGIRKNLRIPEDRG